MAQVNQPFHKDGWIIAAAHAPGKHGAIWRTDLWVAIADSSPSSHTFSFQFCRSGQDNTTVEAHDISLTPGTEVYYFEDVLDQFLSIGGGSWVGAIHYVSSTNVQVWARVYSISSDGTRSYGQLVEGIATSDMSPDQDPWDKREHQWIFPVKHTADGRFRVNVGILNPTGVPSHYSVRAFDATGNSGTGEASRELEVPPYSMIQLLDPFANAYDGEWSTVKIRVTCITEGGGTLAYASVIDNATNDAYFVRGVKLLPLDE